MRTRRSARDSLRGEGLRRVAVDIGRWIGYPVCCFGRRGPAGIAPLQATFEYLPRESRRAQQGAACTMRRLVGWIETLNDRIGRFMGWLMLALVLLVTVDVVSRYLFNTGAVIIQESEWWMFSIIFLSCAGYTFLYDEHVRVDIVYSRLAKKWQHITDITCAFLFLFPMCLLLILTSYWYIKASWLMGEFSPDPGGLPAYYVLKAFIPLGFFLLLLQGIANVYRKVRALQGEPEPKLKDSFVARAEIASAVSEQLMSQRGGSSAPPAGQ
jgi:TRAP-type mannitol/chloroaromatic compound transport system permease small subunit